jgi:glycogen synthase
MASTPEGDQIGKSAEAHLFRLADLHEDRVYFNNSFNPPLSKLILAGGDFFLLPSRFQPCGTIDYEASLMGNVVIGNNIGGVTKVRNCAHLYEWYDVNNMAGEANILFQQITVAVDNYRKNPTQHANMMRAAMSLQVSWDDAALRYIDMYRYGLLNKRWQQERQNIINQFIERLGDDKAAFTRFFMPDQQAGSDNLDWQLKHTLDKIK